MKKCSLLFCVFALCCVYPLPVFAEEDEMDSVMEEIDLNALQPYFEDALGEGNVQAFVDRMLEGDFSFAEESDVFSWLGGLFKKGLQNNLPVYIEVLVLILFCGLMRSLAPKGMQGNTQKLVQYIAYIAVATLLVSVILTVITSTKETVALLDRFLNTVTPILLPLLIAVGGFASGNVLQPAIGAFSTVVIGMIDYIIIPMIIIYTLFCVLSVFSEQMNFKGFRDLLASIIKWSLGIMFIVFLGIVSIQSISAANYDGISIRTAKYTIDKSIPYVGGMFSESLDSIVAYSSIIKNAVGVTGLIVTAAIVLLPGIQIILHIFLLKILNALSMPFESSASATLISGLTSSFLLLLITMLTVALMVFILIAMIVGVGNINLMMR